LTGKANETQEPKSVRIKKERGQKTVNAEKRGKNSREKKNQLRPKTLTDPMWFNLLRGEVLEKRL